MRSVLGRSSAALTDNCDAAALFDFQMVARITISVFFRLHSCGVLGAPTSTRSAFRLIAEECRSGEDVSRCLSSLLASSAMNRWGVSDGVKREDHMCFSLRVSSLE